MARSRKAKAEEDGETFAAGVAALEELVASLESGELPLEEALTAYEQGVGLVRRLNDRLNEAEKKIEILSRNAAGDLVAQPMAEDEDDE